MNTYTKLKDDSWGVRVEGNTVKVGDTVLVSKKDGSTKEEVIDKLLWTDGKVTLCAIRRKGVTSNNTKVCWECGRTFTYADCKANDGDWSDSYCGC